MKKLIILFFIMMTSLFSQSNWTPIVQTNINFNWGSQQQGKIDQFANKDGIHILLISSPTFYPLYYLINSSGSVIRSYQLESNSVEFPSIDGDNEKIYVVYKLGNNIKTRKSINAGQSWTNIADINIGNNPCNHIDIIFGKDDNALHVVWATQDAGNDYETYYKRLDINNNWSVTENVTDESEVGGFPTVSKSNQRVHVSYNTGNQLLPGNNLGDAKSRDKLHSNWESPLLVFPETSKRERIHAGSSKLFDFYYEHIATGTGHLYVKERLFNNPNWLPSVFLQYFVSVNDIVSATNTYDGRTHIVYPHEGHTAYQYYDGSIWQPKINISSGANNMISPKIYGISNDLFALWGGYELGRVYYRQYDVAPLAPTSLTITEDANNHPRLNWNVSPEPDIHHYIIERYDTYGGGWQYLNQTPNGTTYTYTDETLTYCHAVPPAQCPDVRTFYFRVKAVDISSHPSPPSNQVEARLRGGPPSKIVGDPNSSELNEYYLSHNYPNPFNPTTTIDYSIKANGLVTLKVYDILGTEVASLVNENQEAGNYSVEFNATELPSGIYFYTLTSGNFMATKKLILLK